jgi:uncharacterized 2Fe-2S/4Fe-4S cluster protein (DUF4445 family)
VTDVEVVFTPSGRRATVPRGTVVLDVARSIGVDLDSICAGRGICGRCQIEVGAVPGIDERADRLSPPAETETSYRGRKPLAEGRRLACAARAFEDVVIEVPPDSQVHKQVIRKRPEVDSLPVDPVVRLMYVEVEPATLDGVPGDTERLLAAVSDQWMLTGLHVAPSVIRDLQPALRAGGHAVTVAVRDERTIVAVWPGFQDTAFGVAFDIGSTTIAAHLCNLATGEVLASAGRMNPQIRFGEDLMSRVSYVMMNPDGGTERLTAEVRSAADDLISTLASEAKIDRSDVLELVAVGNPIMHHLLLGIDPTPLGSAPFALATASSIEMPAIDVGLHGHPEARLYTLPLIAGHVGADTTAAVLSEAPHRSDDIQLLVDVGTNAEIVLGNRHRLVAASSPTGPAFEGAQISAGQRAAPGAIERVRIDPNTLDVRFAVIGADPWSDEPGFEAAIRNVGVTGICGSGIIEAIAQLMLAGVVSTDGVIVDGGRSDRVVADGRTHSFVLHRSGDTEIRVTQNDVRAIQLAKAALYAGIRLLMDHFGVDHVDQIRLAGAFGAHIDPAHAVALGMIPDCDIDRISAAGNAAGPGAMIALLSGDARREIELIAASIEKIETATEPRFQEHFVEAMAIPHRTAEYPHLSKVLPLPPRTTAARKPRRRKAAT